ncbi:FecR family protein [Azospirillum sp. RWY-5-1]|uniref:FecR family protein n=1 Tax=Azospirillum oleiclasticum TaxID=2735135 RepID=A0ABX2THG6_9PROT|nr:FecR family protein [Azospirillum oleiclasticum]NYZ16214.1 FecR family protein [Azospirillum oleiclasticum]NYZ23701.1 FecR family protein [Azospirillum oleiclasticum]
MRRRDDGDAGDGMDLADEALDWLVRLTSGRADAALRARYAAWRSTSPEHEQAAREAEALWGDVGRTQTAARRRMAAPARRRLVPAVAAVAAALVLAVLSWGGPTLLLDRWRADHTTAVGERREVTLPDGSRVTLNTGSAVLLRFTAEERRVTLADGEALFEVSADPARPFVVEAGGGTARAVGTVYAVRLDGARATVTVAHGVVEVTPAGGGPVRLTAGQRLVYGGGEPGRPQPQSVDAEAETAWRRGKLIFRNRPLADVVAEVDRYRHGRTLVLGDTLGRLPVTGVFGIGDETELLDVLRQGFGVDAVRLPWLTIIR